MYVLNARSSPRASPLMTYSHSVGNDGEPIGGTVNVCQRDAMFAGAGVTCLASGLNEKPDRYKGPGERLRQVNSNTPMSDRASTISSFTTHSVRAVEVSRPKTADQCTVIGDPPVKDENDPKNLDIHAVNPRTLPEGGLAAWCTVIGAWVPLCPFRRLF